MDFEQLSKLICTLEQRRLLDQWMRLRNLHDLNSPDFALTPRTQRLRVRGTEQENEPKTRMLVTALAIPAPPWRELWTASDTSIYTWFNDSGRRYEPFSGRSAFTANPRAMHNGIGIEEGDGYAGRFLGRYLAVERTGVVELGLGTTACLARDSERGFLLTPIVGYVWYLLGFVSDLYSHLGESRPITFLLNLRETKDAVLGGLADGWQEPWGQGGFRPTCREPHVQIRHENVGPTLDADAARDLATDLAFEIEAAWGMGKAEFHPRCFTRSDDGKPGKFGAIHQ